MKLRHPLQQELVQIVLYRSILDLQDYAPHIIRFQFVLTATSSRTHAALPCRACDKLFDSQGWATSRFASTPRMQRKYRTAAIATAAWTETRPLSLVFLEVTISLLSSQKPAVLKQASAACPFTRIYTLILNRKKQPPQKPYQTRTITYKINVIPVCFIYDLGRLILQQHSTRLCHLLSRLSHRAPYCTAGLWYLQKHHLFTPSER